MARITSHSVSRFVGCLVTIVTIGFAVVAMAPSGAIVNVPSFLFVVFGAAGMTLWSFGGDTGRFVVASLDMAVGGGKQPKCDKAFAGIAASAARFSLVFGVLGFIIVATASLDGHGDVNEIASGLACALAPLFYGLVLSELILTPLHRAWAAHAPKNAE